jgi:Rab GDP dissociation inhibitor
MMQTYRFKGFIEFVHEYNPADAKTHSGLNLETMTMAQLYSHFSLDSTVKTFSSHALALEPDNEHLSLPALPVVMKIKTYADSVMRFGNSPYIYPVYGVGNLPEGFTRLTAIHNGVFMLNTNFLGLRYGDDGKVLGISFTHEFVNDQKESIANAPIVIGDPSFLADDDVTVTGQIARCVVIMSAPIPNTNEAGNGQIIIPNSTVRRQNDVYISCLSKDHEACPQHKYLAIMSTTVENESSPVDVTDKKACERVCNAELKTGLALIPNGNVLDKFTWITNSKTASDGAALQAKGIFATRTSDASTHFQSATAEVLSLYQAITGEALDLTIPEAEKTAE